MEAGRGRCLCPRHASAHAALFFLSGNTNSIFALDYISGALTLNGPLDRENPFYSAGFILTVKVRSRRASRQGGRAPSWGHVPLGRGGRPRPSEAGCSVHLAPWPQTWLPPYGCVGPVLVFGLQLALASN